VVRGTTNPVPCCHLANDTDLLTQVLWAMAGDNKQNDLWPADAFTRINPKFNQVVTWSLHTFPENFMQIGPAVFSLCCWQRKKERNRPKTIPCPPTRGGVKISSNTAASKASQFVQTYQSRTPELFLDHSQPGSQLCARHRHQLVA